MEICVMLSTSIHRVESINVRVFYEIILSLHNPQSGFLIQFEVLVGFNFMSFPSKEFCIKYAKEFLLVKILNLRFNQI